MRELALQRTQHVPRSLKDTFAFFADPSNLEAITPPWLRFRILDAPTELCRGSRLRYSLELFRFRFEWRTLIAEWLPPRTFTDVQLAGPYPLWEHTHRFAASDGGTEIHDHVRYVVPRGLLRPVVCRIVGRWLDAIFDYRAARLRELLG